MVGYYSILILVYLLRYGEAEAWSIPILIVAYLGWDDAEARLIPLLIARLGKKLISRKIDRRYGWAGLRGPNSILLLISIAVTIEGWAGLSLRGSNLKMLSILIEGWAGLSLNGAKNNIAIDIDSNIDRS
ncbi:hypothetical protein PPACK8108_LOCUS19687 [Phakopsora pachyrhizi]|uniref:Uncharacterized protein n=1 Tax=Phakopsora pachyrhizi TaxID=170000 RepID=A0AAV0BH02_PHAPC|nr:hypothetical protein PPACK8108_LOCUS19687 [Phakopsora pachyrhizi]